MVQIGRRPDGSCWCRLSAGRPGPVGADRAPGGFWEDLLLVWGWGRPMRTGGGVGACVAERTRGCVGSCCWQRRRHGAAPRGAARPRRLRAPAHRRARRPRRADPPLRRVADGVHRRRQHYAAAGGEVKCCQASRIVLAPGSLDLLLLPLIQYVTPASALVQILVSRGADRTAVNCNG